MKDKLWVIIFILCGIVLLGALGVSISAVAVFIYRFLTGIGFTF